MKIVSFLKTFTLGFLKIFSALKIFRSPILQNRKNAYFYKMQKMLEKAKCKKCLGKQNRIFARKHKIEKMLICKIEILLVSERQISAISAARVHLYHPLKNALKSLKNRA